MAIKIRRGAYADFDPSQLLQGEMAIVTSGDPSASDGIGLYIASSDGVAKQIAFLDELTNAQTSIADQVTAAETAASQAQTYAQQAMSSTPDGYAAVAANVANLVSMFSFTGGVEELIVGETEIDGVQNLEFNIVCSDATFTISFDETERTMMITRYVDGAEAGHIIFNGAV